MLSGQGAGRAVPPSSRNTGTSGERIAQSVESGRGLAVVGGVHWIAGQGGVEGAGAAQHLLLGTGTAEEATSWMYAVGKIEGQHPRARIGQPPGRDQGGLVGDLDLSLRIANGAGLGQHSIRRQAVLGGNGPSHCGSPVHGLARGVGVETGLRRGNGRAAQFRGTVPRDVQGLPAAGGPFVRVQARQ